MKVLGGILLVLVGLAAAFFVGIGLMFIGGIFQIVHGVSVTPVDSSDIAWGIVRIVFANPAAIIVGWLVALPGIRLIVNELK